MRHAQTLDFSLLMRNSYTITQYSSVKENCRRGTAGIELSLEEKILDAVPLQCISFEPN
jgi:hypothetical protein